MKKLLVLVTIVAALVSGLSANTNSYGTTHYVDKMYQSAQTVKSTLKQSETGASNACGPTSLLFVRNYFHYKKYGTSENFLRKTDESIYALERLYAYLNKTYNTVTRFSHLKSIAKNRWGYKNTRRRSTGKDACYQLNEKNPTQCNIIRLRSDLSSNSPALVVLDSKFSKNPTKGTHNIDHIVIVYAYQQRKGNDGLKATSTKKGRDNSNDRIYFYDPYYGNNGYFTVKDIPRHIELTDFAYLKIAQ